MPANSSKSNLTQQQLLRQRLVPQQVRFVKMLELTEAELEEEVERELAENPALEKTPADDLGERRYAASNRSADYAADYVEPVATAREQSLDEYLMEQLRERDLTPRQLAIAEYAVGCIDSNGYFTRTLPQLQADMAVASDGAVDPTRPELQEVWRIIRTLEPAGVGAMDLRDCLLLQLERLPESTPDRTEALEVVRHYFDLFSLRNFRKLSAACGMDEATLRRVNALITTLDPKPGSAFASEPMEGTAAVIPDFIITTDGERVTVQMPNSIPELQVEESFRVGEGSDNEFVRERTRQARTFIDLLRARRDTLMRIMRVIAQIQSDFFTSGDDESRIRPMVLRDLSERLGGMDLSTISRATAGKWVATDWGVYPLKSFFNEKAGSDEEASTRRVMAAIKQLVDEETAPLTDDELTERLRDMGFNVARRTVSKYRTRLGIPTARLRGVS